MFNVLPPVGTITFLFVDFEAEAEPGTDLSQYDKLVAEVMPASGGYLFKNIGTQATETTRCAAFAKAAGAVSAAVALLKQAAPGPRLRMALNTGPAQEQ